MGKNKVEVLIGGNIYSLQGEESKEHIQQVAHLIDKKIAVIQKGDLTRKLSSSQVNMLAALQLADEYLKLHTEHEAFQEELHKCSMENLALLDRLDELKLELAAMKANAQSKTTLNKKSK